MAELELHTDPCRSGLDKASELQPQLVRQRIDALPPFDMAQQMDGLSALLADANQTELAVDAQRTLLNLVDPEIHDLISAHFSPVKAYDYPAINGQIDNNNGRTQGKLYVTGQPIRIDHC